jgi:hypothetical protein
MEGLQVIEECTLGKDCVTPTPSFFLSQPPVSNLLLP